MKAHTSDAVQKASPSGQNADNSDQNGGNAIGNASSIDGAAPSDSSQTKRSDWFLARCLYLLGGFLCLILATAGAFLPVLPCTPFVLLAVFCFARSSTRLHNWLVRSKLFGGVIRDWQEHRAIRRRVRRSSVGLIVIVLVISLWMVKPGLYAAVAIIGLVSVGLLVIFRLPVFD